ncbi:MAG: primosomal protein N' [Ruminococcaceae bacterium]|nr:primosomal protein N' [Oscillospiraceae bacterium]
MTPSYAGVYLLDAPFAIDRVYDYLIPRSLCDVVHRGSFVTVPFGNGNRKHLALVAEVRDHSPFPKHKPLLSVSTDRIALSEHMMGLALFMKEQTLCTIGDAVRAMIPASALTRMTEIYLPAPGGEALPTDPSHPEDETVAAYIRTAGQVSTAQLRRRFGTTTDEALRRLRERRIVIRDALYKDVDAASYTTCRALAISEADAYALLNGTADTPVRSEKHRTVLRLLVENNAPMSDKELCAAAGCTPSVLTTMTSRGYLALQKQLNERRPYEIEKLPPPRPIELNEEQRHAYLTLCDFVDSGDAHAALLHGVTGSGKTSVMLALIKHLLGSGKGAIVLLPEIALTPQSIAIFCSHFGECVAVIHSGLSAGERYDAYERIRKGQATVVVGTRSAVFAPVKNLGAIIIDEEQEHTYKSDMSPKYRAHDIARYRCAQTGALMLLASATPSLESYHKAVEGKYTLIKLTRRYGRALLPEVIISDMRRESASGNTSPLGTLLCGEIAKNLEVDKQSILFLNRRGYHRFISCRSCGEAVLCERCSVAMTYHTRRGSFTEGDLVCHFCGSRKPVPRECPSCQSEHLTRGGFGTQRVEQELGELFPSAGILRMDTDTTTSKFSYDRMLGQFRAHEADILLGTQMVTKGHDFPDVTLVGVLSADASLYLDDYRASERTFAQLTQVIGRAGRGDTPGRAIIQTSNPDNDVIRLACAQDYESFYAREIKLRRLLVFPPFCDLALLSLSCEDEKALMLAARRLYEETSRLIGGDFSDVKTVIFGPFEAPVYRLDNKFRMRMVVKCRLNKRSRELFATLLTLFSAAKEGAQLSMDFNPSTL